MTRRFRRRRRQQRHCLRPSCARQNIARGQFFSVVQQHGRDDSIFQTDGLHGGAHGHFDAVFLQPPREVRDEPLHAIGGTAQPFEEDASEHDAELMEVHVVNPAASIEHHRTKQHVAKFFIWNDFRKNLSRREIAKRWIETVIVANHFRQLVETVHRTREILPNAFAQRLEIVVKPQNRVWKFHAGAFLRTEFKFFATNPQLPQQHVQRRGMVVWIREIGHRMETDVIATSAAVIVGIHAARKALAINNPHALSILAEPYSGRQSRKPRPDDDDIV